MCTNRRISPALSQLEIRIQGLKVTQNSIQSCEADILRHEMTIESITLDLKELHADEDFAKARIEALLDEARKEGFDDAYLERFLREHHCKLDK